MTELEQKMWVYYQRGLAAISLASWAVDAAIFRLPRPTGLCYHRPASSHFFHPDIWSSHFVYELNKSWNYLAQLFPVCSLNFHPQCRLLSFFKFIVFCYMNFSNFLWTKGFDTTNFLWPLTQSKISQKIVKWQCFIGLGCGFHTVFD